MAEGKPFINSGMLFDQSNAFNHTPETDILFNKAMNETMLFHSTHCNDYKTFLEQNGIINIKQVNSYEQIPSILVDVFKKYNLVSVPFKQIKYEILKETNKKLLLDAKSHKRILKIYENIFTSLNLVDYKQKVNYICFSNDYKFEKDNTNQNFFYDILTSLTAHRSVYYSLKFNKETKKFTFDLDNTAKKIIDFSKHSEPVRIIGNSNYIKSTLEWFKKNNIKIKLPDKSFVFMLENHLNNNINDDFYDKLKNSIDLHLSIPKENIREVFILPEQGIPYVSCKCGKLHIPIYAKAIVLDPETLIPVETGEKGLLSLITPYLTAYPGISLLTNYVAILENNPCCELGGKTFKIIKSYESSHFGDL